MKKAYQKPNSISELLGYSVLFAASETDLLLQVSQILVPYFRKLHTVRSGKTALDMFRKKMPDLVLTDLSLPGISGLELLRQIKLIRPSVPVIIFSASNDADMLMQAIDLNVDGYLTKPLNIEKLFQLLQRQASAITARKTGEHESRLLAGVNMAIQYLLSADANQDAVDFALQEMAKAAQADKISLFRYDSLMGEREAFLVSGFAQGHMIRRFLDGTDTSSPEIPYIERWYGILSQGKILTGPRSSFPAQERKVIDMMHAHSLLMTPIFAEGHLWGFACLSDMTHERHWSDAETSMVMTAARGLGSFMGRIRLEEERHEARKALLLSNIQWRETFDTIPDLVMVLDTNHQITHINKAARERLDIGDGNADDLIGHCYHHIHGIDHPPEYCPFLSMLIDGRPHETEVSIPRLNGYFHITVNPTFDAEGNLAGAVHVARDITNRRTLEERLLYLGTHDELTKLYNRTHFEAEVNRLKQDNISPISIVIADLDGLKEINDLHGHDHGDAFIRAAADMLREIFRSEDIIARIGGDEFAVLLKEVGEDLLCEIMQRARQMLSEGTRHSEYGHQIRFSMGSGTALSPSELEKAIREADIAMYADKKARKRKKV